MGFSLYYEAKREKQITEQEQMIYQKIVERYCTQYPFKRKVEDFGVYDTQENTNIVFSGSTKLPGTGAKTLFEVANYWLKCLTEITNALTDCIWTVMYEDVDLILDKNEGWRFPTDEEYHQQKTK